MVYQRLISEDKINRYVIPHFDYLGQSFNPVFKYTGETLGDSHVVEIGFLLNGERIEMNFSRIYLPSVDAHGMLHRNRSVWFPVYMVMPPVRYGSREGAAKQKYYLSSLINTKMTSSSLTDFFPEIKAGSPAEFITPLHDELLSRSSDLANIDDIYQWTVMDMEHAILELFNHKIRYDIFRSMRGGYRGISASMRSIHALIRAFSKQLTNDDDDDEIDACITEPIEEEEIKLGRVMIEDKKGVLVIHQGMKQIIIDPDNPIDFCTCSVDRPIVTARLKDGIVVERCRFEGKPTFPFATYRRGIVGILHDDPHRVIVSRSITQAMDLHLPEPPLVTTDVEFIADSLSLPGVRMTHPLNYDDSIVVSETFANRAGAFKTVVNKIFVPKGSDVTFIAIPHFSASDEINSSRRKDIRDMARALSTDRIRSRESVFPGQKVAVITTRTPGEDGETFVKTEDVHSEIKVPGIFVSAEKIDSISDTVESIEMWRLTYVCYYPLGVGDKLSDGHGNKCTVSEIFPDDNMPVWNQGDYQIRTHYIATPYCGKRMAVGAEIEDKYALGMAAHNITNAGKTELAYLALDSLTDYTLDDADDFLKDYGISYTGTVSFEGEEYPDVPVCYRRMFRLNRNAADILLVRDKVTVGDFGRVGRNSRLGPEVPSFLSRGAANLLNRLIYESGTKKNLETTVVPWMHAIIGEIPAGAKYFEITTRLPREILGNPISETLLSSLSLENTACDPRIRNMYGVINSKRKRIVVAPYEPVSSLGTGGMVIISPFATEVNRVIAEVISSYTVGYLADVDEAVRRYERFIAHYITGKNGAMRKALCPVFPVSIRAVFSPYIGENISDIMIPRSAISRLSRKIENFSDIYGKKNHKEFRYSLIKRDPVHRNQNVTAVRFKTWDRNTIGIHPALLTMKDGDYDGDEGTVMLPTSSLAYADLDKLTLPDNAEFRGGKQVPDATLENVTCLLMQRIGWASTFRHLHSSDTCRNIQWLNDLIAPHDRMHHSAMCIKAARDFEVIKDGTAFTGAVALRFLYSRTADDMNIINEAMELYHVLAQNTLDAKAGTPTPAIKVITAFNRCDIPEMKMNLRELGVENPAIIDELVNFTKKTRDYNGIRNYLNANFPILGSIQRHYDSGYGSDIISTVKSMARKYYKGGKMGRGVWEVLFDFALGRTDESPYDWTINANDLIRNKVMKQKKASEGLE